MKKIFCIIAAFALLTGCDDGDMTYKTFDFTGKDVNTCTLATDATTLKYNKLNGSEGLVLELAPTAFKNQSTLDPVTNQQVPYIIDITPSGTNKLTYNNYSTDAIAKQSICSSVVDQSAEVWKGEGKLSVVTEILKNATTGKIIGYTHVVTMQNISFYNGDETIIINNNVFGKIERRFDFKFQFAIGNPPTPNLEKCTDNNLLYTLNANEVLSLKVVDYTNLYADADFIDNVKTLPIGTVNELTFSTFTSNLTKQAVCESAGGPAPAIPNKEKWKATTGTLRIKRRTEAGGFVYDFYLVDTQFTNTKTTETFNLDDIAVLNTAEDAYYFGTIVQAD